MELHIVVNTVGGFVREDSGSASVLGAYTNPHLAAKIKSLWGISASVHTIEVDVVSQGLQNMANACRISLTDVEDTPE